MCRALAREPTKVPILPKYEHDQKVMRKQLLVLLLLVPILKECSKCRQLREEWDRALLLTPALIG